MDGNGKKHSSLAETVIVKAPHFKIYKNNYTLIYPNSMENIIPTMNKKMRLVLEIF